MLLLAHDTKTCYTNSIHALFPFDNNPTIFCRVIVFCPLQLKKKLSKKMLRKLKDERGQQLKQQPHKPFLLHAL